MARKCKCHICKTELTTDKAYKVQIETKNGKKVNKYYCDSIEYEQFEEEKDCKKNILDLVNKILGYTCVNSIIYKELETIHIGYTYKEIEYCLKNQEDIILNLLKVNGINKEFNKIRYMFAVISRAIEDTTTIYKKELENKQINRVKSEEIEEYIPFSDYNFKESETTDFSNFF